mmetsp:Transcript_17156/g.43754  ORF Transcript_17156/g.43754 Transcript_17156/m.43754 type:complete len:245 (-) Transcript_17156:1181-1915(-)
MLGLVVLVFVVAKAAAVLRPEGPTSSAPLPCAPLLPLLLSPVVRAVLPLVAPSGALTPSVASCICLSSRLCKTLLCSPAPSPASFMSMQGVAASLLPAAAVCATPAVGFLSVLLAVQPPSALLSVPPVAPSRDGCAVAATASSGPPCAGESRSRATLPPCVEPPLSKWLCQNSSPPPAFFALPVDRARWDREGAPGAGPVRRAAADGDACVDGAVGAAPCGLSAAGGTAAQYSSILAMCAARSK